MDFIKNEKFYLPLIYILIGIIVYNIIKNIVNKLMHNKHVDNRRITIISLIKNIIKYLIFIFVIIAILNVYGINTNGILASIGIAGVVIGLALQDIVADFLAGIFIIFDDKYTIGDIVTINNFKGKVTNFGLMSTKIKSYSGEILIISNSSFKQIINHSRATSTNFIKLDVSYNTDIDKLEKVLNELTDEVLKIKNVINYQTLGIEDFSSSSIKYTVLLECKPETQYQVKRDFYKLIQNAFNKNNIEIPYNQLDVYLRRNNE